MRYRALAFARPFCEHQTFRDCVAGSNISMENSRWLIGCALFVASIGAAAATFGESQDMESPAHSSISGNSVRDSATAGDALSVSSDRRNGASEAAPEAPSAEDRASGLPNAPTHPPRTHVGWQSLLPGSIQ